MQNLVEHLQYGFFTKNSKQLTIFEKSFIGDWVLNKPLPHNLIFEVFRDMFMQFTIMSIHYLNINNSTRKLKAIKPNQKQ